MNLFETLQHFKNISPDPAYKEKSKRMVLATTPREPLSAWRFVTHLFETGVAVALAVFFILVITGQFSNAPYVSPARFSVINPETLHAEAQAVDMQIQLASVAYEETTSTAAAGVTNETTPQAATASGTASAATGGFASAALQATGATSSAASAATSTAAATSSAVSVDQALEELSK